MKYCTFRTNLNTLQSETLFNECLIKIFGVCDVDITNISSFDVHVTCVGSDIFINGYVITKEGELFE